MAINKSDIHYFLDLIINNDPRYFALTLGQNSFASFVTPNKQPDNSIESFTPSLCIDCNKFDDPVLKKLGSALSCTKILTFLRFIGNWFSNKGIEGLVEGIRGNNTLNEVVFCWNNYRLCDHSAIQTLLNAVIELPKLDTLLITDDKLAEELSYMELILCNHLSVRTFKLLGFNDIIMNSSMIKSVANIVANPSVIIAKLMLGRNSITDDMLQYLMAAIPAITTLTSLDLNGNMIGNPGAIMIADMLSVNKSIVELNISYNQIGKEGFKRITESLLVNKTLTSLTISGNPISNWIQPGSTVGKTGRDVDCLRDLILATLEEGTAPTTISKADYFEDHLCDFLKKTTTLTHLNMDSISLSYSRLFPAFAVNKSLVTFECNNAIFGKQFEELADVLSKNYTLCEMNMLLLSGSSPSIAKIKEYLERNRQLANTVPTVEVFI
jgi:hypothetical protein